MVTGIIYTQFYNYGFEALMDELDIPDYVASALKQKLHEEGKLRVLAGNKHLVTGKDLLDILDELQP